MNNPPVKYAMAPEQALKSLPGQFEFQDALKAIAYTGPAGTKAPGFGVTFVSAADYHKSEPTGQGGTMRDAVIDLLGKLGAV